MSDFQDVSVKVPSARLAEFYEWYGGWLGTGETEVPPTGEGAELQAWDPAVDLELAATAWNAFPPRARAILSTLIDSPERRFWGEQLATLHSIPNGRYGIAGSFSWPGRTLRKLGRPLPFEAEPDERGGSTYWMTPAMARLFAEARRASRLDDVPDHPA